ncbi:MAG: hypothetical protein ACJAXB_000697, partial [Candidatus Endobugula sp.]
STEVDVGGCTTDQQNSQGNDYKLFHN